MSHQFYGDTWLKNSKNWLKRQQDVSKFSELSATLEQLIHSRLKQFETASNTGVEIFHSEANYFN